MSTATAPAAAAGAGTSTVMDAYDQLAERLREIDRLNGCAAVLGWDEQACANMYNCVSLRALTPGGTP
jgi:hypothetical protein